MMNTEDYNQLSEQISKAVYNALMQSLPAALRSSGVAAAAPKPEEEAPQPAGGAAPKPEVAEPQPRQAPQPAAATDAEGQALSSLKARLFPDFLDLPELRPCFAEWKEELCKGEACDTNVLAICSSLFTWSVFCKVEGAEADASASNALYNFSRYFFEWAYDVKDMPPIDAWHLAHLMQGAFNGKLEEYGALYTVDLPELDGQYEASSMVKSPRSTQGGHDVSAIHAWGLSNTQNNVYKKKSLVIIS